MIGNDHFWKYQYGNWLTGKLSDFAGLFILPLFLAYLFPRRRKLVALASGLFFLFWKSPLSENAIYFYNQFALVPITRVVDYTDLIALSILPLAHWFILHINDLDRLKLPMWQISSYLIFMTTCFAFMATSPPPNYWYQFSNSEVQIKEKYLLALNEKEVISRLQEEGLFIKSDTMVTEFYSQGYIEEKIKRKNPYYQIENLVLGKDTFPNVQFSIHSFIEKESWLYLNGIDLPNNLNKKQAKKKLRKFYSTLFQAVIID